MYRAFSAAKLVTCLSALLLVSCPSQANLGELLPPRLRTAEPVAALLRAGEGLRRQAATQASLLFVRASATPEPDEAGEWPAPDERDLEVLVQGAQIATSPEPRPERAL